ncbi:MAG: DUF2249 domain-containing protein [Rubrivivax sp.]|nr:DUF2249 domain-containing protein [Rubrivivax sp.]
MNAPPPPWREVDGLHIDVRGLAPPAPLVAILQLIETCDEALPVIAHLDRDPVMLYPELAERGWSAERVPGAPDEVRLRLQRGA